MKPLLLIGGGGHCKSVIEVAESTGAVIKGILDLPEHVGQTVLGYPIIGTDNDIPNYVEEVDFIITVGFIKDSSLRVRIHDKIVVAGGHLARLIAPTAYVSKYATIGVGTVVMHNAFVNAGAKIGYDCIINTFANIEHDVVVGDYSHISTGTMLNGDCQVGERTFVGSQSVMVNGVSIVSGCIIAAGSVIRKSLHIPGVYSGNPACLKVKL